MNLRNFLAGVAILQTYYEEPGGFHISVDDDGIFLDETDARLSVRHAKLLEELGWEPRNDGWFAEV